MPCSIIFEIEKLVYLNSLQDRSSEIRVVCMHFTACHSPKGAGPAQRNKKGEIKRVTRPQTLTSLIPRNLAFSSVVSAILLSNLIADVAELRLHSPLFPFSNLGARIGQQSAHSNIEILRNRDRRAIVVEGAILGLVYRRKDLGMGILTKKIGCI
jgi:hypothetical protein